MAQITIEGALTVGPTAAGSGIPALIDTVSFATTPNPKSIQVYTSKAQNVQSAVYVTLSGVGLTDTVTRANCLYVKTSSAFKLRLTQVDLPTNLVSELYISGLTILEFPEEHALIKVEVFGSGILEMVAAGNV